MAHKCCVGSAAQSATTSPAYARGTAGQTSSAPGAATDSPTQIARISNGNAGGMRFQMTEVAMQTKPPDYTVMTGSV